MMLKESDNSQKNNAYQPAGNHAYDYLKNFDLLSCLSDEQLQRVHQHSKTLQLKKDVRLFNQGDAVHHFYLVINGRVKLSRISSKGEEKIIDIVADGKMFAEALMFMDNAKYPVNATAIVNSEVVAIDATDFAEMLRESVDTCFKLLADMSFRLHALIHEIDTLSLHTGTCRVASYIMQHSPVGKDNFKFAFPKSVIASRLSVKPETFSRILKDLNNQGVLSVEGCNVTIHDRQALESMCMNND